MTTVVWRLSRVLASWRAASLRVAVETISMEPSVRARAESMGAWRTAISPTGRTETLKFRTMPGEVTRTATL